MARIRALKLIRKTKRGQSIIEYLVVVGVIIAAIIALRSGSGGGLQGTMVNILNTASDRIDAAQGNSTDGLIQISGPSVQ